MKEYKTLVENNSKNIDFKPLVCHFAYDNKNRLTKKEESWGIKEVRYKYNSFDKLKEIIGEGIEDSVVFKYDNQGKLNEKYCYSHFEGLQYIGKYNLNGNVYQKDTYMYGKYAFRTFFEYNDKGLLVKETLHNENGVQSPERTEYIYDSNGNWIKKTKIIKTGNSIITTRIIDYWTNLN